VVLSPKERARVGEVLRAGGVPDLGPLKNEAESVMTATLLQPFLAKVYSLSRSLSSGASLLDEEISDSSAADKERRRVTHQLLVTLLLEPKNREVLFGLLAGRAEEESGELAPAATELLLLQDAGGCEALLGAQSMSPCAHLLSSFQWSVVALLICFARCASIAFVLLWLSCLLGF
jgi:hypothetical protein